MLFCRNNTIYGGIRGTVVLQFWHMKRTNVLLPKPMLERLLELAKRLDLKIAEIIRRAIDEYLEKFK